MQAVVGGGFPVSLREVLPEAQFRGSGDIRVGSCARDSRRVRPGDLFVALPGSRSDGHDFIAQAVAHGCQAVVAQRPIPDISVPVCYVPDTRAAYGRICQALAGHPSRKLKVIGISGNRGKTTTSCLVAGVLATGGCRVGLVGTLGGFDGDRFGDTSCSTPPADELAGWLRRMVANGCSHAVLEVSSRALDQVRLAGVTLDMACMTNVRRDCLGERRAIRDYRLSQLRIMDYLAGEGMAILNADDSTSAAFLSQIDRPTLTVAMESAAEISGTLVERQLSEQAFLLTAGSDTAVVRTRMIGRHHVSNCLMAAAVGLAYGIDLMTVVRGLEKVDRVPGRLERIECGQPFGVFVDVAHTPGALTGCLESLREVVAGRLICVFGAAGERGRRKRPLIGRAVEEAADVAVVTSDNPRGEDARKIIEEILSGFRRPGDAVVLGDRSEAIGWALSQAEPGDCVLIAGKGHEQFQIIGDRRLPFDDREVARRWLYEKRPCADTPVVRHNG